MGRSFIFQLNNMSWTHLRLLDSSKTSPDVDNRQRFGCWALLLTFTVVVLLAFVGNSYHWVCEDFWLCHSVYTPAWIFVSEKFFSGLEFLLFWCNVSGSQRTWNGEHEWSLCAATMQIIYRKMRNFLFNRWMGKTVRARRTKYSVHRTKLLAIYAVSGTKSLKST